MHIQRHTHTYIYRYRNTSLSLSLFLSLSLSLSQTHTKTRIYPGAGSERDMLPTSSLLVYLDTFAICRSQHCQTCVRVYICICVYMNIHTNARAGKPMLMPTTATCRTRLLHTVASRIQFVYTCAVCIIPLLVAIWECMLLRRVLVPVSSHRRRRYRLQLPPPKPPQRVTHHGMRTQQERHAYANRRDILGAYDR